MPRAKRYSDENSWPSELTQIRPRLDQDICHTTPRKHLCSDRERYVLRFFAADVVYGPIWRFSCP